MVYQGSCEALSITTRGLPSNHDSFQVITLIAFNTIHLILVAMGGESCLISTR